MDDDELLVFAEKIRWIGAILMTGGALIALPIVLYEKYANKGRA